MYMDVPVNSGVPPIRDAGGAWSEVAAAVKAVDSALDRWMQSAFGVGITEYRASRHLILSRDRELRINDLAERVDLNQSSATRLVGRMEAKGLAYRDTCPNDGRGIYAVITERGVDLANDIHDKYEATIQELLHDAPSSGSADIRRALSTLSAIIS